MIFKLDIEKTYDMTECDFLTSILSLLGSFPHSFDLNGIFHTQCFYLMVTGSLKCYFPSPRGCFVKETCFTKPFHYLSKNTE